jgi:hypothetical protein
MFAPSLANQMIDSLTRPTPTARASRLARLRAHRA